MKIYDNNWFIDKAKEIHGDKYDYSLVNYINLRTKVKFICPIHGEFEQTPDKHFRKHGCQKCAIHGEFEQRACEHINNECGCPFCKESLGERKISIYLNDNNIKYQRQKKFKNCKNIQVLPFDFYLPDYNTCIEFDGIQHYFPIKYFGGINKFKYTKNNDKIKTDFCLNENIKLIRIKYNDNISEKIKDELSIIKII